MKYASNILHTISGYFASVQTVFDTPVPLDSDVEMACYWGDNRDDKIITWYRTLFGEEIEIVKYTHSSTETNIEINSDFDEKITSVSFNDSFHVIKLYDVSPPDKGKYYCTVEINGILHQTKNTSDIILRLAGQ